MTLKDGASLTATINDIKDNPKKLKFQELEAAQVSKVKGEVAYVVLNRVTICIRGRIQRW